MITTGNYDHWRSQNFALRAITNESPSVEDLVEVFSDYDPIDAAEVVAKARIDADLNAYLDRLELFYQSAIESFHASPPTPEEFRRATLDFYQQCFPLNPAKNRWPWLDERTMLLKKIEQLTDTVARLTANSDKGPSEASKS